jgi:hypothetical protein
MHHDPSGYFEEPVHRDYVTVSLEQSHGAVAGYVEKLVVFDEVLGLAVGILLV